MDFKPAPFLKLRQNKLSVRRHRVDRQKKQTEKADKNFLQEKRGKSKKIRFYKIKGSEEMSVNANQESISRKDLFKKGLLSAEKLAAELADVAKSDGPRWGMVIDLRKCIGCSACTVACKSENRTPPGISYNVVMHEEHGVFPDVSVVNIPRPCMQCDKPACMEVCPVGATFKMDNGIVGIDYDRCIGCRYCMVACPYGARSYDFGESYEGEMLAFDELQASEYGRTKGIRKKGSTPVGIVRKCTFCYHRLERGEEPACIETCVGDARFFGDLSDPNSEVSRMLNTNATRVYRLREYLSTEPRVYYLR